MASSSLRVVADATEVERNNTERRPRKRSMQELSTCKNCSPYFATSSPPTTTSSKLKGVTTTSQRAHKKRHHRSRSPPPTTTTTTKTSCSSPHFSTAPSSVLGSLATLDPIFFTWTELSPSSICTNTNMRSSSRRWCCFACTAQLSSSNNNNEEDDQMYHHHSQQSGYNIHNPYSSSITSNNATKQQHDFTPITSTCCEFCQIIIQDAIRHFWNKCDIFDQCYNSKMKEYGFMITGATTRPDTCFSSSNLPYPNSSTTTSDDDDDDPNASTLRQQHCTIEPQSRRQVVSCRSGKTTNLHEATMKGGSGGKLLLLLSCLEVAAIAAEESVRHLCANGCYLKAYSPCRDWIEFRHAIHQHTDVPVGKQAKINQPNRHIFVFFFGISKVHVFEIRKKRPTMKTARETVRVVTLFKVTDFLENSMFLNICSFRFLEYIQTKYFMVGKSYCKVQSSQWNPIKKRKILKKNPNILYPFQVVVA